MAVPQWASLGTKMKIRTKVISGIVAAALLSAPAISYAGKRPAVPVGLHLAPTAALAAQTATHGVRKAKKVQKDKKLLGGFFIYAAGALFTSTRLVSDSEFASRGAN